MLRGRGQKGGLGTEVPQRYPGTEPWWEFGDQAPISQNYDYIVTIDYCDVILSYVYTVPAVQLDIQYTIVTDRVSRAGTAIGSVRPSVRPFVFNLSSEPTDL